METPVPPAESLAVRPGGEMFMHEPLDHTKPSIRLLNVERDLSPDGLIQCTLFRSKIDSRYNCLSYAWGEPAPFYNILVNGKVLRVRQNLFDFLHEVRKTRRFEQRLWIDAIWYVFPFVRSTSQKGEMPSSTQRGARQLTWGRCTNSWNKEGGADSASIDQSNTSERNHQVQQMGNIYAGAQCVLLWLGEAPGLAPSMAMLRTHGQNANFNEEQKGLIQYHLLNNAYWSRAWITQEIGLARRIIVLGAGEAMPYSTLLRAVKADSSSSSGSLVVQFHPMKIFASIPRELRDAPLMTLLSRFREKQCSIRSDRIYSLLSLCAEENRFHVDYSLSELDLLVLVLEHCKKALCFCTVGLLAQVLGLVDADISEDHLQTRYLYIEFDIEPESAPEVRGQGVDRERRIFATSTLNCDMRPWADDLAYFRAMEAADCCHWVATLNHDRKIAFMPLNATSPGTIFIDWYSALSQELADGFVLSKSDNVPTTYSLRMPLMVWIHWLHEPVILCYRGHTASKETHQTGSLRIGYTTGVDGGEGFVGQVLPERRPEI
jgi:hypothetical protein